MKRIKLIVGLVFSFIAVASNAQQLHKVWETDSVFKKPESVVYDASRNVLFVSSINGNYGAKDGNGFISEVSLDGKIIQVKWMEGLDNPPGLGLYSGKLYVADLHRIVVIDIAKQLIDTAYTIDSSKYLNDICINEIEEVFVSDIFGNKVYKLAKKKVEVWSSDPLLNKPNGLLCIKNNLMVLNFGNGTVYKVANDTKAYSLICTGINNGDGITNDNEDGYFVSGAWQGQIFHVSKDGNKELVLNLGKDKIMAADIFYEKSKKLLLVPNLNKSVIAYSWE
ncbi:ATP/GTP-binding protein [Parasediminibacterium sp. JCM 36343]|uniref:ATP/GTP-binding protein n=1 Tax=Parasediminibacterium sp. JCM 36343 TaxID=3374279 RepID=UPI00397836EA